jgi:hypothetical protein
MNKIIIFFISLSTLNLSFGQDLTHVDSAFFGLQRICQTRVQLKNEFGGTSGFIYVTFFSSKIMVCTKKFYCEKSIVPLQRRENTKYIFVYDTPNLAKSVFSIFVEESKKEKPNSDFWNFVKPGKFFLLKGDTIEMYQYNSCADNLISKIVLEAIKSSKSKQSYIWINCGADHNESIIVDRK